jgi:hypothetical protein
MKNLLCRSLTLAIVILLGLSVVGCDKGDADSESTSLTAGGNAEDHQGHAGELGEDMPANFAVAVADLKEHYQQIKQAFEQGDDGKADEPLHRVGHLLEHLPELARKAELPSDDLEAIEAAAEKMFEAYATVHEPVHNNQPADYAAVADSLDEAMASIEAVANKHP